VGMRKPARISHTKMLLLLVLLMLPPFLGKQQVRRSRH
jgi:hypothetical protein